ncbi:hypothetical protein HMPREF9078_00192 [Capnocytophaga sp. oral taxon 380 str. F0488]|nr:hypothetical protein HMPREF9078_00192 [Capnocytophaga sp. oral taxon 380 str. F0488]
MIKIFFISDYFFSFEGAKVTINFLFTKLCLFFLFYLSNSS